jgi:uncharacterized membrane protein
MAQKHPEWKTDTGLNAVAPFYSAIRSFPLFHLLLWQRRNMENTTELQTLFLWPSMFIITSAEPQSVPLCYIFLNFLQEFLLWEGDCRRSTENEGSIHTEIRTVSNGSLVLVIYKYGQKVRWNSMRNDFFTFMSQTVLLFLIPLTPSLQNIPLYTNKNEKQFLFPYLKFYGKVLNILLRIKICLCLKPSTPI